MGDRRQPWEALAAELYQLSERKRAKVFGALSPRWEPTCPGGGSGPAPAPYQRGWDRRAYRSPDPADGRGTVARAGDAARPRLPVPPTAHLAGVVAMHVAVAPLGGVLASAIDAGNREIAAILRDSLQGRHPVSGPSTQAYAALLAADDPAGWEVVETLAVSAQRAEGLRQAILEAADVARPEAFARLLSRVVELDLSRFAGTVRAVGVWFGDELHGSGRCVVGRAAHDPRLPAAPAVRRRPARGRRCDGIPRPVDSRGPRRHSDGPGCCCAAQPLTQGHRLAAARLLTDLALPSAGEELVCALEDPALPVYAAAVAAWPTSTYGKESAGGAPAGSGPPSPSGSRPLERPATWRLGYSRPPGPEGGRCACG